jgi:hypothetical protein
LSLPPAGWRFLTAQRPESPDGGQRQSGDDRCERKFQVDRLVERITITWVSPGVALAETIVRNVDSVGVRAVDVPVIRTPASVATKVGAPTNPAPVITNEEPGAPEVFDSVNAPPIVRARTRPHQR